MFGNWIKTFVLMAGITALFGAVGAAMGGCDWHDYGAVFSGRDEFLRLLVFR